METNKEVNTVEAATQTEERTITWDEVARDPAYLRGELIIGEFFQVRGPIKSIRVEGERVMIRLKSVAVCRTASEDRWVRRRDERLVYTFKKSEFSFPKLDDRDRVHTKYFRHAGLSGDPAVLLPQGLERLDPIEILNEYHLEVAIAHPLYPPSPFKNIERVGILWQLPAGEGVKKTSAVIVFVVHARTREGAEAWARGECARWDLPITGMEETRLLPGY